MHQLLVTTVVEVFHTGYAPSTSVHTVVVQFENKVLADIAHEKITRSNTSREVKQTATKLYKD